jgi:CheY-like chemotaxis protein
MRVLAVDDEEINRAVLSGVLRAEGCEGILADSPRLALEIAATTSVDLMLLDVIMPQMDGFELCRQLRRMTAHARVPILMLTALDESEVSTEARDAGAQGVITKPLQRARLRAWIQQIRQRKDALLLTD